MRKKIAIPFEELLKRIPDRDKMNGRELTRALGLEMAKQVFAEMMRKPEIPKPDPTQ